VEFKWRQFEPQLILMAVGWYLRFSLSYRDVEELLQERGMSADHVTVWRWVQRYTPELDRRIRSRLKPTNKSWRVDETYIRVKGKWTMDLFVFCIVFVSGGGLGRCQHRFSALRPARCGSSQAVLSKGVVFTEPPKAAGHQCGYESFLPASR
jgi:hypothetical protein